MKRATLSLVPTVALAVQAAAAPPAPGPIEVNGAQLHYLESGSGTPVVLVHGGLEDYRAWLPHLDGFSARHRTVLYSRRHNHPNQPPAPGADYSARTDAADLAALIEKLELAPAHVVGVSYGAYTALLLAVERPGLVRSLVLAEPPLIGWLPELEGGEALHAEFMQTVWEPTIAGFRKSNEAGLGAAIGGFGELGYSGSDEKLSFDALPPPVQAFLLENAPEWKALAASAQPFPELPVEDVKRVKTPALLLSGERSLALHGLIDRRLADVLPDATHVVIPNATHEMWNEQGEACRKHALEFLQEH